jgi:hypothetical protein
LASVCKQPPPDPTPTKIGPLFSMLSSSSSSLLKISSHHFAVSLGLLPYQYIADESILLPSQSVCRAGTWVQSDPADPASTPTTSATTILSCDKRSYNHFHCLQAIIRYSHIAITARFFYTLPHYDLEVLFLLTAGM